MVCLLAESYTRSDRISKFIAVEEPFDATNCQPCCFDEQSEQVAHEQSFAKSELIPLEEPD